MAHVAPSGIDPRTAWEPYRPDSRSPWDLRKAGHLHRRAGFGASWPELERTLADGPERAVAGLLAGGPGLEAFDRQLGEMARSVVAAGNEAQMRAWWLFRMLHSPHPLQEKLTLFWHNHFATSNAKVNNVGFMMGQNALLRRHALGNFRDLLQEMSKDPAMMVWLDTVQSKKGMPNENYARELMELFSLGIGHYTEQDIRQAARAFTGWEIKDGRHFFNKGQHDTGPKTVLGQTGSWNGEDIVRICLDQPAAAEFIATKLFRFLVSESDTQLTPSPELIAPLADRFRRSGYDFQDLVATVLRSNVFFSEPAYRARVKAPAVFAVGIVRALEGRIGTLGLAEALENLGQRLFYPPSVKGWDGGTTWLNSSTLLLRHNLALALTSTEDQRFGRRTDPAALARKYGKTDDEAAVAFFVDLFFQGDLPADARANLMEYARKSRKTPYPVYWSEREVEDHRLRALCHLVLTQPEFQLD
jgi:uncharacterized protein (DUF1800 family)